MYNELLNEFSVELRELYIELSKCEKTIFELFKILERDDLTKISANEYLTTKNNIEFAKSKKNELNIRIEQMNKAREMLLILLDNKRYLNSI